MKRSTAVQVQVLNSGDASNGHWRSPKRLGILFKISTDNCSQNEEEGKLLQMWQSREWWVRFWRESSHSEAKVIKNNDKGFSQKNVFAIKAKIVIVEWEHIVWENTQKVERLIKINVLSNKWAKFIGMCNCLFAEGRDNNHLAMANSNPKASLWNLLVMRSGKLQWASRWPLTDRAVWGGILQPH